MYFVYYICTEKLRLPLWSCQNVLRILHHTTLACTEKLRLSSRSCQSVLRIVATFQLELPKCTLCTTLVLKVAISSWGWELAECTSHTTLVRKSRDFRARAAKTLQTDAEEKIPILTDTEA